MDKTSDRVSCRQLYTFVVSSFLMLAIPPLWWELYEDWNQFTEMESTNKTRMKKLLLLQRVQNHLGDKTAFSDWWGRGTVTLHDMVDVELCETW